VAAQWLTEEFKLTAENACAYNNWPLRKICVRGYQVMAQWLVNVFELMVEDVSTEDNWALYWA